MHITVSDLGEFGVVQRVTARLGAGRSTLLGPGDDAAVVTAPDRRVVVSTDVLVEGRHFRRDWSSGYDVGCKAAAQNLADVAAMGGRGTALVVGLVAPGVLPLSWLDGLADGLSDEAAREGAAVVGGDLSAGDAVVVAVTVLGDLDGHDPITRSGAVAGDAVVVAGRLGWAAAGLAVLGAGGDEADWQAYAAVVAAHRRPQVPYDAARALARNGARALIDVSDGLAADVGHLAEASGVAVVLDSDRLVADPAVRAAADRLGVDPLDWLAGGGDDHAFAAAVAPSRVDEAVAAVRATGTPVFVAGSFVAGSSVTGSSVTGSSVAGSSGAGSSGAGSSVRWVGRAPSGAPGHDHFAHRAGRP